MPLFEITTISVFRHKYVVEAKTKEDAHDAINHDHPEELSQKPIEEVITDSKKISTEEFQHLLSKVKNDSEKEYGLDNAHMGEKIIYRVKYPKA